MVRGGETAAAAARMADTKGCLGQRAPAVSEWERQLGLAQGSVAFPPPHRPSGPEAAAIAPCSVPPREQSLGGKPPSAGEGQLSPRLPAPAAGAGRRAGGIQLWWVLPGKGRLRAEVPRTGSSPCRATQPLPIAATAFCKQS